MSVQLPPEWVFIFAGIRTRDRTSWGKQNKKPKNIKKHLIKENTDFNIILKREGDIFFEDNLPKFQNYHNSSIDESSHNQTNDWPLSYVSTIVWPIRYILENTELNPDDDDQELLGFLTIDSNSKNNFERRYDIDLGAIIADSLFPVLKIYSKLRARQKENT